MTAPGIDLISDEDLVLAAAQGDDPEALEELYRRHWDASLLFAKRLVGNDFDAEDVTSESFLKVVAAIRRGLGPKGPFRPYMFRAVRSCAADHWAGQARQTPNGDVEAAPEEDPGYAKVLDEADRSLAASAFAALPIRWQTVLWHLDVEGDPPRRVAPLLGLEPNAVSAVAARARKGLRQEYLQAYVAGSLDEACQPTLPLLAKSVVESLSGRESRKLRAHSDRCLKCKTALADLEDVSSTMRRAVGPWFLGPAVPLLGIPGIEQLASLPADPGSWLAGHGAIAQWFVAAASVAVVGGIATAVIAPTVLAPPPGASADANAQISITPTNPVGSPDGSYPIPTTKAAAPSAPAQPAAGPDSTASAGPDQGQFETGEALPAANASPDPSAVPSSVLLPGGALLPAATDLLDLTRPSLPSVQATLLPPSGPTAPTSDPAPADTPGISPAPDENCTALIVLEICLGP